MSNKISGLGGGTTASVGAGRRAGKTRDPVTGGSSAPPDSAAVAGDVHITDSASQLASLEQAVRSLPAVDPVRVAQFQTAIEEGTYTVRPQHVADQLMQLEQSLGSVGQLQEG